VATRLNAAADRRHSNRRRFDSRPISANVVDILVRAAQVEGSRLHTVRGLEDRLAVARLTQRAEVAQIADPAYPGELRAWTTRDPQRRDGVPAAAIPRVTGAAQDDIPIREFDRDGTGELPAETRSRLDQTMFVLGTPGDSVRDWLVAGQALARVLLELTSAGLVASIFSQVTEIPATREQLRHDLRLTTNAQLLLRVGFAVLTPPTPRRALTDVIS